MSFPDYSDFTIVTNYSFTIDKWIYKIYHLDTLVYTSGEYDSEYEAIVAAEDRISQKISDVVTGTAAPSMLDDLSDVNAPTPSVGDVLQWDGAEWVSAASPGGVSDHGALTGLSDDDHTQYALADGSRGTFEASGAVAAHVAAVDPHTQYQKESEKSAAGGYASLDSFIKIPIAEIPTGTSATTVCIGDDSRLSDSRSPSGSAGGDLTGTYPNPSVANDTVSNAKLANMADSTIKGRASGAGAGDPTDLTGSQVKTILAITSSDVSDFNEAAQDAVGGSLADSGRIDFTYDDVGNSITADIIADSVSNTYLSNMADSTIKGRTAGAGTGDPVDLTAAQVKTILAITSGDVSDFNEAAQDAVGGALTDSSRIDFTYSDVGNSITADLIADSVDNTFLSNMAQSTIKGRAAAAGTGDPTDLTASQVKTILAITSSDISDFNEAAQDAVGGALTDSSRIDFTYSDVANTITADLLTDSVDNTFLANMAQSTIKGRASAAGTGDPTDLSASQVKTILGLKAPTQTILTVGTGTYNTPSGCTAIIVEVVGAGGGGAGANGSATQASAGAGGGSGGYARKLYTNPAASYTYTVGAKGTGGTAGGTNGNDGNASTFNNAGTVVTANPGLAGTFMTLGTSVIGVQPGNGAAISTNGDVNFGGASGGPGLRYSASVSIAGWGGSGPWGGGGRSQAGNGHGLAATGYGSGGAGGCVASINTARTGGDGADGVIIITEYYD